MTWEVASGRAGNCSFTVILYCSLFKLGPGTVHRATHSQVRDITISRSDLYLCVCVRLDVCLYVRMCVYVCDCITVCTCMCMCLCVCVRERGSVFH